MENPRVLHRLSASCGVTLFLIATATVTLVLEAIALAVQMLVMRAAVDAVPIPDVGVTGMAAKVLIQRGGREVDGISRPAYGSMAEIVTTATVSAGHVTAVKVTYHGGSRFPRLLDRKRIFEVDGTTGSPYRDRVHQRDLWNGWLRRVGHVNIR